jgi:hypothetical protein
MERVVLQDRAHATVILVVPIISTVRAAILGICKRPEIR